jgi:ribose 5-phosphate isomerase A
VEGGGGCQLQEKIVASCAKKFVIIADYTKDSDRLGQKWLKGVPIEVSPMAYVPVAVKLKNMGGEPVLRMAISKAGPCVTDNGNLILDTHFGIIENAVQLEKDVLMIPGVVEVGLFCGMAEIAFLGMQDGSVKTRRS